MDKTISLEAFDGILFLNLDRRIDRRLALLAELSRAGVDMGRVHRVPAILDTENGHRGCLRSHIQALTLAKQFKQPLILEDDIYFKKPPATADHLITNFLTQVPHWDVYMLGARILEHTPTPHTGISRIIEARCGHAYAPAPHYIDTLLAHLTAQTCEIHPFDYTWRALQKRDRWYCTALPIHQRPGYSDIYGADITRLHPDPT